MSTRRTRWAAGLLLALSFTGCDLVDPDFLERQPSDLLTDDQVWNNADLVDGVLANLYGRISETKTIQGPIDEFARWDEAMWSGRTDGANTRTNYPYSWWSYWDYGLVRDLNLFLEKVSTSTGLTPAEIRAFEAEGRFLRAYTYFELVKRMGGVPIVTATYVYDFNGDASSLQFPRNSEAEVYDFIASELDAIVNDLPSSTRQTRANRWTALAMKSRAMLYAASIAKYNSAMPAPITLEGDIVGIPSDRAQGYYEQSLAAAEQIIQSGNYQLYDATPDRGQNFYEALNRKQSNPEVIWAIDFVADELPHRFTYDNMPASMGATGIEAASLSPALNLVEAFEKLDGTSGPLAIRAGSDFVYYEQPEDLFADRDPRLWGTIIYPGAEFRGREVVVQAGVLVWDSAAQNYDTISSNLLGSTYDDGGVLVGRDGPVPSAFSVTNTGFHLRKHMDSRPNTEELNVGSDVWWPRYRYAEVLLNAAEAAFELGREAEAVGYVNQVRERAGFGSNSLATLTMDRIRNERRVELAFENHRFYDMKRWRLAHEAWNGNRRNESAVVYALWPYRVVRPGDPRDGSYVFVKKPAPRVRNPRFFRMGNYYAQVPLNVLDANPKIVANPFH